MKLRAVRRINFVAAITGTGCDHTHRRRRRLHSADLNGGGMCAQQSTVRHIKCILLVAGGVVGRGVERIKAMPFIFDVWSVGESESHAAKNVDRAIEHLSEGMERAALVRSAGQRDVNV